MSAGAIPEKMREMTNHVAHAGHLCIFSGCPLNIRTYDSLLSAWDDVNWPPLNCIKTDHCPGPTPITFTRCLPDSSATGVGRSYRPTFPALSLASIRR